VNQTGSAILDLMVESSDTLRDLEASVYFTSAGYLQLKLELDFDAHVALHEVAFDISHTSWSIDSSYGQFRQLYRILTKSGIAVDELRSADNLSLEVLSLYDAVFVLDPCAWAYETNGFSSERLSLYSYTPQQLAAYADYFADGGNLFLVGLSNSSIDQYRANELFSQFNITLNNDHVPGITIVVNGVSSTELITEMIESPITDIVDAFDYNGCSLNFTGDVFEIAWEDVIWVDVNGTDHFEHYSVLVGLENGKGGRLLATGSNFFLDNWALSNLYRSDQDLQFVLQSVYWLLHVL
jgi:hypothetical protein